MEGNHRDGPVGQKKNNLYKLFRTVQLQICMFLTVLLKQLSSISVKHSQLYQWGNFCLYRASTHKCSDEVFKCILIKYSCINQVLKVVSLKQLSSISIKYWNVYWSNTLFIKYSHVYSQLYQCWLIVKRWTCLSILFRSHSFSTH